MNDRDIIADAIEAEYTESFSIYDNSGGLAHCAVRALERKGRMIVPVGHGGGMEGVPVFVNIKWRHVFVAGLLAGIWFFVFSLMFPGRATAQEIHAERSEYSIPWFMNNPAARREALRICRDDHRVTADPRRGPICANAEKAETRLYANTLREAFNAMDRPEWWTDNPALRSGVLSACRRRAAYDAEMLRYCKPAQQSARES